jgi:hypothetical protein
MLMKQFQSKRKQFSLKLVLSIYLIFACERALGATLFTKLDNLVDDIVTSNLQFEIEAFLEQERQNWEAIAEKILVSNTKTDSTLGLLVANSVEERDRGNVENSPLSIRSIVETFKQLDLETDRKNATPSKVPKLPQVAYRDIDKGVYVFEPTAKVREKATNSILFDRDNFASAGSFGKIGSLGISGFSISTPNPIASFGTPSVPQPSGARGIVAPVQLSAPISNAQLSLLPHNQISTSIGSNNTAVNNVLNALNSFGGLKVDVGFRLLPAISVPGELDLNDDTIQKSKLVRSNLAMVSPIQLQVQERIERDAKKSSNKQRGFQFSMYEQASSRRTKYRQIQIASTRRLQKQQKQQIKRQQDRQAQLKEKFDRQLEHRLQRFKERQRNFK